MVQQSNRKMKKSSLKSGILMLCMTVYLTGCSESIHDLVGRKNVAQVEARLKAHPDQVNQRNALQKTPLHYAVSYEVPEMIEPLVSHGADLNAADITGMTPLHVAAMWERMEEATKLLELGAKLEVSDSYGDTPLHIAAIQGRTDMVKFLLEKGSDVTLRNKEGLTPLDLAKRYRREKTITIMSRNP